MAEALYSLARNLPTRDRPPIRRLPFASLNSPRKRCYTLRPSARGQCTATPILRYGTIRLELSSSEVHVGSSGVSDHRIAHDMDRWRGHVGKRGARLCAGQTPRVPRLRPWGRGRSTKGLRGKRRNLSVEDGMVAGSDMVARGRHQSGRLRHRRPIAGLSTQRPCQTRPKGFYAEIAPWSLVPLAGMLYRMRVEESVLLRHFGPAYKKYASRTKRLLPGIY